MTMISVVDGPGFEVDEILGSDDILSVHRVELSVVEGLGMKVCVTEGDSV